MCTARAFPQYGLVPQPRFSAPDSRERIRWPDWPTHASIVCKAPSAPAARVRTVRTLSMRHYQAETAASRSTSPAQPPQISVYQLAGGVMARICAPITRTRSRHPEVLFPSPIPLVPEFVEPAPQYSRYFQSAPPVAAALLRRLESRSPW